MNMKLIRKYGILLLLLAACLLPVGRPEAAEPGEAIKIGLTLPAAVENQAFKSLKANLNCLSEELPVTFLFSENDNLDTVSRVESLIRQKVDGVMVSRMEEKELPVICGMCEEAGVYWGLFLWDIYDDDIRSFCEASEYYAGNTCEDEENAGRQMLEAAYRKGCRSIALISESEWHTTCRKREAGIIAAARELPGTAILETVRSLADREDAKVVTENLIRAWPEMDCIILVGSVAAGADEGILEGIRSMEAGDRVSLMTFDFSDGTAEAFEEGILTAGCGLPQLSLDPYYLSLILINRIYGTPLEDRPVRCCIRELLIESPEKARDLQKVISDDNMLYYKDEELHHLFKWEDPELDEQELQRLADRFQESLS